MFIANKKGQIISGSSAGKLVKYIKPYLNVCVRLSNYRQSSTTLLIY